MLRTGMSKSEIEKQLEGKGNFTQIGYLNQFLKESLTIEMKKFIFLKLGELYEKIGMLEEAAKMYNSSSIVSITFSEKIRHFVKETELYIKTGNFDKADGAMKKAMAQANSMQKQEIYFAIRDFYKKQGEYYEKELKRNHAARIYEKLLEMKIGDSERREIKEKLLELYEKLGKRKEYLELERRYLA